MISKGFCFNSFQIFWQNIFSGGVVKNENMLDQELAEELHKPIIKGIRILGGFDIFT